MVSKSSLKYAISNLDKIHTGGEKRKMICNDPLFLTEECQLAEVLQKAAKESREYSSHLAEFAIDEKNANPPIRSLKRILWTLNLNLETKPWNSSLLSVMPTKTFNTLVLRLEEKLPLVSFTGKK